MNPFKKFFNCSQNPSSQPDEVQDVVGLDEGTGCAEPSCSSLDGVIPSEIDRENAFERLRPFLQDSECRTLEEVVTNRGLPVPSFPPSETKKS
jgi:hypothetical protein